MMVSQTRLSENSPPWVVKAFDDPFGEKDKQCRLGVAFTSAEGEKWLFGSECRAEERADSRRS